MSPLLPHRICLSARKSDQEFPEAPCTKAAAVSPLFKQRWHRLRSIPVPLQGTSPSSFASSLQPMLLYHLTFNRLLPDSQKANVKLKMEHPFGKLLLEQPSNSQGEYRKLSHRLLAPHPAVMNLEQRSRTGTTIREHPQKNKESACCCRLQETPLYFAPNITDCPKKIIIWIVSKILDEGFQAPLHHKWDIYSGIPQAVNPEKKNPLAQLCKETCAEKLEPCCESSGMVLQPWCLSRAKKQAIWKMEIKCPTCLCSSITNGSPIKCI